MNLTIIGATGMVGSRLVIEAAARGHRVIAAARHPNAYPDDTVTACTLDAGIPARLDAALVGADAAILAIRAPTGEEHTIAPLTTAVLDATDRTGARLLIVGGAGPLRSPRSPDLLRARR